MADRPQAPFRQTQAPSRLPFRPRQEAPAPARRATPSARTPAIARAKARLGATTTAAQDAAAAAQSARDAAAQSNPAKDNRPITHGEVREMLSSQHEMLSELLGLLRQQAEFQQQIVNLMLGAAAADDHAVDVEEKTDVIETPDAPESPATTEGETATTETSDQDPAA